MKQPFVAKANKITEKVLEKIEEVIKKLNEVGIKSSRIGAKYGELRVAYELRDFEARIENEKPSGHQRCDVWLKEVTKGVEVKWSAQHTSKTRRTSWGWGFNEKQIKGEDIFDYCILLASGADGKPKHIFLLTQEKLSKLHHRQKGGIAGGYYLHFYEDFNTIKQQNNYRPRAEKLETELNEHPENFEKSWEGIRKQIRPA